MPIVSDKNSTINPLGSNQTFTGRAEDVLSYTAMVIACKTDQDGTLYVDFSVDGLNWDSSLSYNIVANINTVHRIVITRPMFRTRYVNGSTSQTYLRLNVMLDSYNLLSSPLNSVFSQDADAIVTRSITEELSIAEGNFAGHSIINKYGTNTDISSATVPEDVWEVGGVYAGWATSAQTLSIVSSDATDASGNTGARQIRIIGLDANYNVLTEVVTLNGLTPVTTTGSFLRLHTATVISAGTNGVNAGTITVKQSVTTTNVMLSIAIGRNQSNCSAYTVPAGHTGYIRRVTASLTRTTSAVAAEGSLWIREFNGVFRSRRPFGMSNSYYWSDEIYGGLVLPEKSDVVVRITFMGANNIRVAAGYDLILVKNT